MSHSSTSGGYRRSDAGRKPKYSRPVPALSPWGDRRSQGLRGSQTRTSETIEQELGAQISHDSGERMAGSHNPGEGKTGGSHRGKGGGFLRRSTSEGQSVLSLPEERIVSGELKAAPQDIMPPRSFSGPGVPPLTPLREPPYLAPQPPVDEEEDYEYPLFDCTCFQIYWSPFFADFCSNTLGMTLKHSSKKGTPAHGNLRPVKEGRVFKAIRKVGEKANKKGSELKREWTERRPTWNYQDAHFQQMELELQRLRQQLSVAENTSLPNTIPAGSSEEPWSSRSTSQFRLPPSGSSSIDRRFTMT